MSEHVVGFLFAYYIILHTAGTSEDEELARFVVTKQQENTV
jgi:hypothetical protein